MAYKISSLLVKNFKCFDNSKYYKFSFDETPNPIVLSGPNGFGKTTFFDAIELIFTKTITRLDKKIEHRGANLGGNILLNDLNYDGTIVLNLKNEKQCFTSVIALIGRKQPNLSIEESLRYCLHNESLETAEDIDGFINSVPSSDWRSSLSEFEKLTFKPEHFAVYYYVSQAESVHFLKKSINERSSSINALLNTDTVDSHISRIEELIGKSANNKVATINKAIEENDRIIKETVSLIKSKIGGSDLRNVEYEQMFSDSVESIHSWDARDVEFNTKDAIGGLSAMEHEVRSLYNFVVNKNDYEMFLENEKVQKLIVSRNIDDFCKHHEFIYDGTVDSELIRRSCFDRQKKVDVYMRSKFFRDKLDISAFKKEDLIFIQETEDGLLLANIEQIADVVENLKDISKRLSDNQNVLNGLKRARLELRKFVENIDKTGSCPYCATQLESNDELDHAFSTLSAELSVSNTNTTEEYSTQLQKLESIISDDKKRVLAFIDSLDDSKINGLSQSIISDRQFVDSAERISIVEQIFSFLKSDTSWIVLDNNEKCLFVENSLREQVRPYNNPNFEADCINYNFREIAKKYSDALDREGEKITQESIERKISYLRYKHSLAENAEITKLKEQLRDELIREFKLERIRTNLSALKTEYEKSIKAHGNQVSEKLRVPLLIYTSKILQDYQNGLGVFISRKELRFVPNGNAKHDILNTFSSGQLSGFVLSFLLAMNKQYIRKSNDDIDFILVDDPVQTMDDINIASLVEVLRNDFGEKQIILSTHESDKENYILYKFLKYNLRGQSFNVKERLYAYS
jgi:exonuclease SbcC